MLDSITLAIIVATFLLAGTVKGVIGLGLPTVSLALLTATMGLHPAMALMLAPSLVTNIWQAAVGGHFRIIFKRTWTFLATAMLAVWLGADVLTRVDVSILTALLGVLVITYSLIALAHPHLRLPGTWEPVINPLLGIVNGLFTGMTGTFVFPGVLFLQSLGLTRDQLIQAMGLLFTCSTAALAVALGGHGLLSQDLSVMSVIGVIPALIGMVLGQKIRGFFSESLFRKVFFGALILLGGYIIARTIFY